MSVPTRSASVKQKATTALPAVHIRSGQPKSDVVHVQDGDERRLHRRIPVSISDKSTLSTSQSNNTATQTRRVVTRTGISSAITTSSKLARTPSTRLPGNKNAVAKPPTEQAKQQKDQIVSEPSQSATRTMRTVSTANSISSKTTQATRILRPSAHTSSARQSPSGGPLTFSSSKPSNYAVSIPSIEAVAHTASLENEFFQLNLLYNGASPTLNSYKQSLRQQVIRQGDQITLLEVRAVDAERKTRQVLNSHALKSWLSKHHENPDDQQIQILSRTIQDLEFCCNDLETGQHLEHFQSWMKRSLHEMQDRYEINHTDVGVKAVELIDLEWNRSVGKLHQRLCTCLGTLQELDSVDKSSGVAVILKQHIDLASTLLREIETALSIEADIIQVELAWRAEQVKQALDHVSCDTHNPDGHQRTGVWCQSTLSKTGNADVQSVDSCDGIPVYSTNMDSFDVRLLKRAIGQKRVHQSVKPLYGDKTWAQDLDVINELGGHTGCVNALSWSSGGSLLASGSDDTYLNIWDYNPASLAKPFTLNTSVNTGHTANIFSVKFMPHSNDRTVVTCAGDSEVRVFDLEYGGSAQDGTDHTQSSTRSRRFNNFFGNARWLNESNTNARVYRSHADRAKRIVTESSPHLFLSCSEDGEVRQWDLRQPSSAYPAPHGARRMLRRSTLTEFTAGDVPPPLISYKKYALDLNSISCSASQPQYIALGGAHLHCFLHDRRMLGRDISEEQGRPGGFTPNVGSDADEIMREQTRCVRRFAPNNQRKMGTHSTGHITACKISDARPNELISSWSGDHIYTFDIVRSPDARDAENQQDRIARTARLRNRSDRKRKRLKLNESSSNLADTTRTRLRKVNDDQEENGQTALRVRYGNGATEDVLVEQASDAELARARELLTEAQQVGERIARSLVQLRKTLFDFSAFINESQLTTMESSSEYTHFKEFTTSLGQACNLLPEMEDVMRSWSYPIDPSEEDVTLQNTLRRNRQAGWRFVQAAGCLSKVMGGRLQTLSSAPDPRLAQFDTITPAFREENHIEPKARFSYDFLKAILLWLNGGQNAVLKGFQRPVGFMSRSARYPLIQEDTVDTMIEKLNGYLMDLADSDKPIIELGTNRFERDEHRHIFQNQQLAVRAFIRALAGIELRVGHGISYSAGDTEVASVPKRIMDKGAAVRFWGLKVGRSLLLEAAEGVTFSFTQQAFGGPRIHIVSELEELGHPAHTLSDAEDERVVDSIDIVREPSSAQSNALAHVQTTPNNPILSAIAERNESHKPDVQDDVHPEISGSGPSVNFEQQEEQNEQDEDDNDMDVEDTDEEEEDDDDDDDDEGPAYPLFRRRVAFGRAKERNAVNLDVPYTSHTRIYRGHCNTRTVKDVNYYGLDDEYIVSGSDDGHFFIWDRKSSQIVNILQGDNEVVNVVQGHPFEPMIACSGIDSTVKIFGPSGDRRNGYSRERYNAMKGVDIANPGGSVHSSLRFGGGPRSNPRREQQNETQHQAGEDGEGTEPSIAKNGLEPRRALERQYEITSQNDAMRQEGLGDAFVTEGMLARFAAVLQQGGTMHGINAETLAAAQGGIVIDQENCSVM